MAEALLKRRGGEDFCAFSAGIEDKSEVHPLAADFLQAYRVWHQSLRSKRYQEFLASDAPHMELIITIGERLPAGLPIAWPGHPQVIHWHITDPVVDSRSTEKPNSP